MKTTKRTFTSVAFAVAIATTLLIGCNKKGDAISSAEQADKKAGVAAPGIEETKAIAEEGFIYGLPLVMNYAVMNEFAVDTKSSQFKAPFNEINNEHRVATPGEANNRLRPGDHRGNQEKLLRIFGRCPPVCPIIVGRQGGSHPTCQHWYRIGQGFRLQRPFF